MADTLLTVRDLHTHLGDSYVVQGASLEVRQGSLLALLGRNGMGKTTLIRSILNLIRPTSGEVLYQGRSLAGMPAYRIAQMRIALVPQGRRIFPSLSVSENLLLPASRLAGNAAANTSDWSIDRVFEIFPRLRERSRQLAGSLSGGEQSMLAIGRALMCKPELLLMDEPSEGLAPVIIDQLKDVVRDLRESGISILLVEQNIRFATDLADEVSIMTAGQTVFTGTRDEFEADDEAKLRWLGV